MKDKKDRKHDKKHDKKGCGKKIKCLGKKIRRLEEQEQYVSALIGQLQIVAGGADVLAGNAREKEFLEDQLTKKKAAKHPRFFKEVVEVEEEKPQA